MSKKPNPSNIWITVNRACNFRCEWCYASSSGFVPAKQMSLEEAEKLLNIVGDLGVQHINIIGGEPTLWTHLFKFNDMCREREIRTTLVTNALRFSDDKFWNEYLLHPNDAIGMSFKDCTSEELWRNAKVKAFDKVDKGLRRGMAHFKKGLSFVYAKSVEGRLVDMVKYAIDFGARGLTVSFCTPSIYPDHADSQYMVDTEVMVREISETYEEINELLHGAVVYSIKHPLCIWPREFLDTIVERGQIMTTCHLQHQTGGLFDTDGSLLMCNGLSDFPIGKYGDDFNSAVSLVKHMRTNKVCGYYEELKCYPSDKCTDCYMYEKCAGGCPLLWSVLRPDETIVGF